MFINLRVDRCTAFEFSVSRVIGALLSIRKSQENLETHPPNPLPFFLKEKWKGESRLKHRNLFAFFRTLPFFPQEKEKGRDGFGNLIKNLFIQHILYTNEKVRCSLIFLQLF